MLGAHYLRLAFLYAADAAPVKNLIADILQTVWQFGLSQAYTVIEGFMADAAQILWQPDSFQAGAVSKSFKAYADKIFRKLDIRQPFAVRKSHISNLGDIVRNDQRSKTGTAFKGPVAYT